jgi:glycosyltransferase involved in cell wall biosynthesis
VTPAVSVIMPVFNAGSFLRTALESVLQECRDDVELVIVDDGSHDGSGEVAREYIGPNVRVLTQPNGGLTAALRAGIEATDAPVIARMDADDVNVAGRITSARRVLDTMPQVGLVSCFAKIIDENGVEVGALEAPWLGDDPLRDLRYLGNNVVHGAAVFRRSAYEAAGGYRDGQVEDYDLWLRMTAHWQLALIPETLYWYRRHSKSLTGTGGESVARVAGALTDHAWTTAEPSNAPTPIEARRRHRQYIARGGQRAGRLYCSSLVQLAGEARRRGRPLLAARYGIALAVTSPGIARHHVGRLLRERRRQAG